MARWQPEAPERLAAAALDLFAERGYENTTVIDIASRAGLAKSTFFRHFRDKREVLFGGGTMARVLGDGIAAAPEAADPITALAEGLEAVGSDLFTPERRASTARRRAVIAAHPDLREREALKALELDAAMRAALERRGTSPVDARVAAKLGGLVLAIAYERWTETADDEDFGAVVRGALTDVREAVGQLSPAK